MLIGPSGAATVFRGSGDSTYVSPPGNFTVLKKVGSNWELSPRGSLSKLIFDSNGRLTTSVDQNGLRDSIAYSSAGDTVKTLVDPLGKTTSFYYVSGKLDSIVSLTGTAARTTQITVDGSHRLTTVTLAPGATRPYTTKYTYTTYSGTDTYVLAKRIGQVSDTTIVSYDATYKRPTQSRLPQVTDETGATINPVLTYTAYEEQGLGSLRSLDSVYVEVKDPRNNWTRSLLNRWGQARKTWDALGVIGRTQYDPDGFVLWSEGKVADSSRTYNTYDALHRLARSFIIRAVGDTLRVDSLVYDVNHRVIKRLGARGDSTKYSYDTKGNILTVTDPAGNVSQTAYNTDGTVWKTWAPGSLVPREYLYISTWHQPYRVLDEAGTTVDRPVRPVRTGLAVLSEDPVQVASGEPPRGNGVSPKPTTRSRTRPSLFCSGAPTTASTRVIRHLPLPPPTRPPSA
jgi:YD repeat-containing protein